jgi:hypothetical protein
MSQPHLLGTLVKALIYASLIWPVNLEYRLHVTAATATTTISTPMQQVV